MALHRYSMKLTMHNGDWVFISPSKVESASRDGSVKGTGCSRLRLSDGQDFPIRETLEEIFIAAHSLRWVNIGGEESVLVNWHFILYVTESKCPAGCDIRFVSGGTLWTPEPLKTLLGREE